jgi:glycine/D-amino acid oxidase-like deaminating enzyme
VSGGPPFLAISPWVAPPDDLRPALDSDTRADAVVIGGGYTGLSTALALRARGADVVLLERDFAGAGASGRNAGHLTPTIGKDVPTLLRLFGRERASALLRFADAAVIHTEETIRKHGIACDYAATGNVLAGLHARHEARLRRAAEVAGGLGAEVRYLEPADMRARGLPDAFHCGVLEERGGHLHPGRYVSGLRSAAVRAGVRLYVGTALEALEPGAHVTARTPGGAVTADVAVLATNAWTPTTGWQQRRVAPLRVSLFETEPLAPGVLEALGWRGREGVYTAHEVLESYRLTAHGTLVGGSRIVRYAYGSGLAQGPDPSAFRVIEAAMRDRFPALGETPVAAWWGGWIGFTVDFLPVLGTDGPHHNVHYGIGYAGHGVAQATLMGELLAARVQGETHEWESALRRRRLAWPPEPLRWAAARVLLGALEALDRRTDRRIRAAARGAGQARIPAADAGRRGSARRPR